MIIFAGLFLAVVLVWLIATYNRFVRLGNLIRESWSNVDSELKRRYDLIPNLERAVKGYARHEREVLENLTRARSQALESTGSPASQARDENELISALRSVLAVAENYPELKASRNFLQLQEELANTEDRIQAARRFYNGNVRENNVLLETFPSRLVASLGAFTGKEYFSIEESVQRQPPRVDSARGTG